MAIAVFGLVALAAIAYVAVLTPEGQRIDQAAMESMVTDEQVRLRLLRLLGNVSVGALLVVALASALLALARGRVRLAVGALVVLGAANVSTQLIKAVLDRPVFTEVAPNSLPSGHTTAVAAAVSTLLIVAPRLLRPLVVGVGSGAVAFTALSTVAADWHRPSDILAALAVVLFWHGLVVAAVSGGDRRGPIALTTLAALGGTAVGAIAVVVLGVRPSYGWSGATDAAMVVSAVVAAVAVSALATERTV